MSRRQGHPRQPPGRLAPFMSATLVFAAGVVHSACAVTVTFWGRTGVLNVAEADAEGALDREGETEAEGVGEGVGVAAGATTAASTRKV